jgi:hypothetical protein
MSGPLGGAYAEHDPRIAASITGSPNITALADQSGNAHHLDFPQGTPKTGTRTINGFNAIKYGALATDGLLATTAISLAPPYTVFVVAQADTLSATGFIYGANSGNQTIKQIGTQWSVDGVFSGGTVDLYPHVFTMVVNGAASVLRLDGVQIAAGTCGAGTATLFYFGGDGGTAFNGLVGQDFIHPGALVEGQLALVEEYLAVEWLIKPRSIVPQITTLLEFPEIAQIGLDESIVGPPIFVPPTTTAAAQSVALTPATVTVTAQALGRTPGAVTVALTPDSITVTAQTLGRTPGAATRALTPATVTVTAQALARTTAISRALTPASITVSPQALARTVGGLSRALTPASVTVTAKALARTLGTTSVAITPAQITVTARALARTVGAVTAALAPAQIAVTPRALGVTTPDVATVPLSPAIITVTPSALGVQTEDVTPPTVVESRPGGRTNYAPSNETREYWEQERRRISAESDLTAILADDEEVLVLM